MRQKTTKKSKYSFKSSKDSYTKRRSWTLQEDEAIRRLVKENGIKQWTVISEKLSQQFNTQRTGKQCRERWHNHLNPGINKDNWSLEEELCLFESHEKLGNKWAEISKILQGRTDNSIKNHFYSTLRKRFRKIKGYDGTRDDIKQHNKLLSAKILGSLKKMTDKAQNSEESTNLEENSGKCEEKIEHSESFPDFMPLDDNELIITGHHISNPYVLNMNSYYEEAPAEFLWSEDPFLSDEVFMISLK